MKVDNLLDSRSLYINYVKKHCYSATSEDAEDIVQDVYLYLYKKFGNKKLNASFLGQLVYKKLNYLIADFIKNTKNREDHRVRPGSKKIGYHMNQGDIFDRFAKKEPHKRVDVDLEVLLMLTTPNRASMLRDFYLKGCNHKDLIKKFKVTLGTVKKTLSAGREQIKNNLKKLKEFIDYVP